MILTCPSCGTQYVVKDGAIPPDGRQVRCAACKHSWHQDPEQAGGEADTAPQADAGLVEDAADAVAPPPPDQPSETSAEQYDDRERETPATVVAEPEGGDDLPAADDSGTEPDRGLEWKDDSEPVAAPADDEFAPFGTRDRVEHERRGNPILKLLLVVLLVAAIATAFWFLAPSDWKSRLGIAAADESPLQLMLSRAQPQQLASGNTLLTVSGRVINPTGETQQIPPIRAELRRESGELVHSWTIDPPTESLPPGGRAPFYSAEVDVPEGGQSLTLTFGAPKA